MKLLARLSVLGAAAAVAGLLAPIAPAAAAGGSVAVTGVTAGATVSGAIALTATATAPSGDTADEINFMIDGASADLEFCALPAVATCTKTYTWNATGLSGPHTVQAVLKTENGATVSGAVITVTVVSPAPTVALTSPASGTQVPQGTVAVTAAGAVNPSQVDTGSFGTLLVDGQAADTKSCPAPPSQSCALTFSWDSSFATAGTHTLTATFETLKGVVVTSAPITVTVHVLTKSVLEPIDGVAYGHTAKLAGELSSTTGAPIAGVLVNVVIKPAGGKTVTKTVTTDSAGDWKLSYKATANSSVVASVPESPAWGASHASQKLTVFVTGNCVTKDLVHVGATGVLKCTKVSPALKKAKVQVQIFSKGKWHTFTTVKVSGTKFSVPFRITKKGTAEIRLLLPATKYLTDSVTSSFFIAVV